MNIILLSGGSGKRLWPLSNDVRSKQFLKVFKRADGEYESMVQRIYAQIKQTDLEAKIIVATAKTQVSAIQNQLGMDVDISLEPCRRDTFPAIALATAYMVDVVGVDENEPVVVCPVDPYVEQSYFNTLKELSNQVERDEANLVLMGITPTYPSEKYGYIIPATTEHISDVVMFKEKPDMATAEQYIAQGGVWNGGVFAYKPKYVLEKACDEFSDKIDVDHIEKCRECKYRYVCGGGCRAPMINNYNEVKEQADCELSTAYFEKIMDSIKKSIS